MVERTLREKKALYWNSSKQITTFLDEYLTESSSVRYPTGDVDMTAGDDTSPVGNDRVS